VVKVFSVALFSSTLRSRYATHSSVRVGNALPFFLAKQTDGPGPLLPVVPSVVFPPSPVTAASRTTPLFCKGPTRACRTLSFPLSPPGHRQELVPPPFWQDPYFLSPQDQQESFFRLSRKGLFLLPFHPPGLLDLKGPFFPGPPSFALLKKKEVLFSPCCVPFFFSFRGPQGEQVWHPYFPPFSPVPVFRGRPPFLFFSFL